MSKIPYFFETPTPRYFSDQGWFKPKKDLSHLKKKSIIDWCFSRCCPSKRKVYQFNRYIELEPYEFIYGRHSCSDELGLTEGEVRHLIECLVKQGFLLKTSNSVPNKYNCYRWVVEKFTTNRTPTEQPTAQPTAQPTQVNENQELEELYNQPNNQHSANCTTNTAPQSISIRSIRVKEDIISREALNQKIVGLDFVNENFERSSSNEDLAVNQELKEESKHNLYYRTTNSEENETIPNKVCEKEYKNKQKQNKPSDLAFSLLDFFYESLQIHIPTQRSIPNTPKKRTETARHFDKILEMYSDLEIRDCINYGHSNDFWQSKGIIKNPRKLEEHIGTLLSQLRGKSNETTQRSAQPVNEPKFKPRFVLSADE